MLGARQRRPGSVLNHRSRRALAVTGVALLLALVTTGCGRRDLQSEAGTGASAVSPTAEMPASSSAAVRTDPPEPVPPEPAVPGTADGLLPAAVATPPPTLAPLAVPLATPDLTAIQQLLDDLDATLGADATADTDEGSSN